MGLSTVNRVVGAQTLPGQPNNRQLKMGTDFGIDHIFSTANICCQSADTLKEFGYVETTVILDCLKFCKTTTNIALKQCICLSTTHQMGEVRGRSDDVQFHGWSCTCFRAPCTHLPPILSPSCSCFGFWGGRVKPNSNADASRSKLCAVTMCLLLSGRFPCSVTQALSTDLLKELTHWADCLHFSNIISLVFSQSRHLGQMLSLRDNKIVVILMRFIFLPCRHNIKLESSAVREIFQRERYSTDLLQKTVDSAARHDWLLPNSFSD